MSAAWRDARNVLCVRLDNLGDVLMTTPAIRALREQRSGRRIALLASKAGAQVARSIDEIDEAIGYDAPWVAHANDPGRAADLHTIELLRERRFDAAVIFTVCTQSALPAAMMCRFAGIPLRVAYSRENPYQLLTDRVLETEPESGMRHEVRRQLDLVASISATTTNERLSMRVERSDRVRLLAKLAQSGLDASRPWVLVHPGATAQSRRYPPEHFAAAARLIYERLRMPIVFGGTADERALVEEVRERAGVPSVSLAGALSLGECAASIATARVLVSNNSGPVHIASAVGTPVVDLYALTNPQHTPWQVPHRVLSYDVPCRNCFKSVCPQGHHDCLRKVEPERVVEAVAELLGVHAVPMFALAEAA